jgi:hypothetical protein
MLNSTKSVIAFVPGKYVKSPRANGEVQIALNLVDFEKDFAGLAPRKLSRAIREKIEEEIRARKEKPGSKKDDLEVQPEGAEKQIVDAEFK